MLIQNGKSTLAVGVVPPPAQGSTSPGAHHLRFYESGVQVALKVNPDTRPGVQGPGRARGDGRPPGGGWFLKSWTSRVHSGAAVSLPPWPSGGMAGHPSPLVDIRGRAFLLSSVRGICLLGCRGEDAYVGGGSLGVSVEQDARDPSASQTSVGKPLSRGSCYHADSADLGWELRLCFRQASR